ncbi:hypothetical protein RSOLAG22IIIB_12179 [Rhizoctonia solani]|uniref:Uncharacterized protein n=1 Tax=Rhizoctonia solani TaxID=456999 RepID=A0A0K6GD35_9AGAM|nr:hypothetical protein RSOLAG22IIIB_12179 [Rhizoctonia solani]
MPSDLCVELVPSCSSPTSDIDSLVFDSSSEGVHTPNDQRSPAGPTFDAAKGIASVGVTVHSPPARFVGTPFATVNGPNSLFEYPFPATRPALLNTSSISSVASSIFGPPSPSTRAKFIPRMSPQHPSKRRVSGAGVAQVRIPPRLRTDSSGSVGSNSSQAGEDSGSTSTPKRSRTSPAIRPTLPHSRLRDRSGSLGVLPISLPPPTLTTVGVGAPSAGPISPAVLVGAMVSTGLEAIITPRSDCEADESELEPIGVPSGKRRASVPAMFAPRLEEDSDSDSGLDREDVEDHPSPNPSPSTPQGIPQ